MLHQNCHFHIKANQHTPARAKAKEDYILSTKLFCGTCGRAMLGESGKGEYGAVSHYDKCAGKKKRLEQLERQKETLGISLVDLKIRRPVYTKEQIAAWISQFRYGNIKKDH